MRTKRTLVLAGLAMMALGACGFSLASSDKFSGSSLVVGSTSAGSGSGGAGGLDIHNDYVGGAGGGGATLAGMCGGGCTPGTGKAVSCAIPAAGGGGTGGAGGASSTSGGGGAAMGSCQLGWNGMVVAGQCGAIGAAQSGQPCLSTHDCAGGFGCVGSGVCRPYCCGDLEACPAQTFCAPVPLAPADAPDAKSPPSIPVCQPAEPCTLLDDNSCAKTGQTCTIVRSDGTVSCVDPGKGKAGESCPCAAGFVCSFALGACLKLCHTNNPTDCPMGYQCSGGSKPYPSGFGVCVKL